MKADKIGIVGSGLIGRAWAMLFASVGYQVQLYDVLGEQVKAALHEIELELRRYAANGSLRGTLSATEQFACISGTASIEELVHDAMHIQECIPERIDWKRSLYEQLDALVDGRTIISSSTSTFVPSLFSATLQHRANVLVSHPLNPPYFIPLVEIVPAPWTDPMVVQRTRALMLEIGQRPVILTREVNGFATNRIQYAILDQVWHLVEDGVISACDADTVMKHGLGLRYALLGPFETAHLNADGVSDYFARYGQEVNAVTSTYPPPARMAGGPTLERIAGELEASMPRSHLPQRRQQRDEFLLQLCQLKRHLEGGGECVARSGC